MKKIFRMLIFSGLSLYIVSLINKGFILPTDLNVFLQTVLMTAFAYYLVLPVSKLIFLPINIFTFGLVSFGVFVLFIYIMSAYLDLIRISTWLFNGGSFFGITLNSITFDYTGNLIVSSLLISVIIRLLESLT